MHVQYMVYYTIYDACIMYIIFEEKLGKFNPCKLYFVCSVTHVRNYC